MIFESRAPRAQLLKVGGGAIRFRPGTDRPAANADPFGIFDTTSTDLELAGFKSEADCIQAIKDSPGFQKGDIWVKDARLDRERGAKEGAARSAVVANMTEAQLRGLITASGVACPGPGTELTVLRGIADDCLAGRLKAGAVPETPAEETTAEEAPAERKPEPAEKRKRK